MRFEGSEFYKVGELAEPLKLNRSTVYRAIEAGELSVVRFGTGRGALRIAGNEANSWLARCGAPTTDVMDAPADDESAEVA